MPSRIDLLPGTLDILILKAVSLGVSDNNRRAKYYRLRNRLAAATAALGTRHWEVSRHVDAP